MVLLSPDEITRAYGYDNPANVAKVQLEKVVDWGDEDCTEHAIEARKSIRRGLEVIGRPPIYPRRECHTCWRALLKEASGD